MWHDKQQPCKPSRSTSSHQAVFLAAKASLGIANVLHLEAGTSRAAADWAASVLPLCNHMPISYVALMHRTRRHTAMLTKEKTQATATTCTAGAATSGEQGQARPSPYPSNQSLLLLHMFKLHVGSGLSVDCCTDCWLSVPLWQRHHIHQKSVGCAGLCRCARRSASRRLRTGRW